MQPEVVYGAIGVAFLILVLVVLLKVLAPDEIPEDSARDDGGDSREPPEPRASE